MNVTSFLDARYKAGFLETESEELNEVREELLKNAAFLEFSADEEEDEALPSPAPKKAKLSLGALTSLKKKETVSSTSSPRSPLSKEIDIYLSHPVIDGDDEPLQWWKVNAKELPLLSQLVRKAPIRHQRGDMEAEASLARQQLATLPISVIVTFISLIIVIFILFLYVGEKLKYTLRYF